MNYIRCVCFDISIEKIVKKAKEKNLKTLEEVLDNIDCGRACGLCRPYIEKALKKSNK